MTAMRIIADIRGYAAGLYDAVVVIGEALKAAVRHNEEALRLRKLSTMVACPWGCRNEETKCAHGCTTADVAP